MAQSIQSSQYQPSKKDNTLTQTQCEVIIENDQEHQAYEDKKNLILIADQEDEESYHNHLQQKDNYQFFENSNSL